MSADYDITIESKEALKRYVKMGIKPGGFLTAVICNDLLGAVGSADSFNKSHIPEYVEYLFNEVPGSCWGSPEAMQSWMEKFR